MGVSGSNSFSFWEKRKRMKIGRFGDINLTWYSCHGIFMCRNKSYTARDSIPL